MSDDVRPLSPKARTGGSTAIPAAARHKQPRSTYEQSLEEADRILASGHTLKPLSAKQECFAIAYAEGSSASEAYRYAYRVQDVPWQVAQRAAELVALPYVAARVREIKRQKEERLLRDRDTTQRYVIDNLQKIIELPGSHHSARVHALTMLGKLSGLFDGSENASKSAKDTRSAAQVERELKAKLAQLLGDNVNNIKALATIEHDASQVIANNPDAETQADSLSEITQAQDDPGGGG